MAPPAAASSPPTGTRTTGRRSSAWSPPPVPGLSPAPTTPTIPGRRRRRLHHGDVVTVGEVVLDVIAPARPHPRLGRAGVPRREVTRTCSPATPCSQAASARPGRRPTSPRCSTTSEPGCSTSSPTRPGSTPGTAATPPSAPSGPPRRVARPRLVSAPGQRVRRRASCSAGRGQPPGTPRHAQPSPWHPLSMTLVRLARGARVVGSAGTLAGCHRSLAGGGYTVASLPRAAPTMRGDRRMAIWNQLRQSAQTMQAQLAAKKNDLKSGAFRDASMAMCALVAAADGSIDQSERQRVAQLIAANDVLQQFRGRRFATALRRLPGQAHRRLRLRQGERPPGDRQGEEEAHRGSRRDPDRHRHRRRRRRLRRHREGCRARGVLRVGHRRRTSSTCSPGSDPGFRPCLQIPASDRGATHQPSSCRRSSSMPKWWPTSWITVRAPVAPRPPRSGTLRKWAWW